MGLFFWEDAIWGGPSQIRTGDQRRESDQYRGRRHSRKTCTNNLKRDDQRALTSDSAAIAGVKLVGTD